MANIPSEFSNVSAVTKANIYFGGRVVSHSIVFPDGNKKTLGLIYPGAYYFGTGKAELMEIVAGSCSVKLKGTNEVQHYKFGDTFSVPANSGFDIESVEICEYICSFID